MSIWRRRKRKKERERGISELTCRSGGGGRGRRKEKEESVSQHVDLVEEDEEEEKRKRNRGFSFNHYHNRFVLSGAWTSPLCAEQKFSHLCSANKFTRLGVHANYQHPTVTVEVETGRVRMCGENDELLTVKTCNLRNTQEC
ncbi:hypothetical protein RRG08_031390 [Elysia crispata]|uniref:Uncharacterized protein n=1 Tax=Elysia crispata TaxID=231223 RepID=A0AAE1DIZ3_9GAST|nr:hypothetical protein RRG08_031390 [Elysia crispata]